MRWMRWILPVVAVLLLTGSAVAVQLRDATVLGPAITADAARPVVQGNRLVDARSGRQFVPRGVNWSSFEYACAQGWGVSALDTVIARDPAAHEAEAIAAWGANTVRLPLNQDCWLGTRGAPVSDEFQERTVQVYRDGVHDFVSALNRAGLVVILDLHSRKRIGQYEFGNVAMPDSESLAFWRSVATVYRDNPSVMFDAFNEPYSRYNSTSTKLLFDLSWPCWRDGGCAAPVEDDQMRSHGRVTYPVQGMASVVGSIRAVGAKQPILLGGLDYANDLSHWLAFAPDDDQLVAAFHSYDFKECGDPACWNSVLAPIADTVPLITSELGATHPARSHYVASYLRWADERHVGVVFWVWSAQRSDPMSLVTGDKDRPTAYGTLARRWLRDVTPG